MPVQTPPASGVPGPVRTAAETRGDPVFININTAEAPATSTGEQSTLSIGEWAQSTLKHTLGFGAIASSVLLALLIMAVIYRLAHYLYHSSWGTPPGRFSEISIGRDGLTLKQNANEARDAKRDDQIDRLDAAVDNLIQRHDTLALAIETISADLAELSLPVRPGSEEKPGENR